MLGKKKNNKVVKICATKIYLKADPKTFKLYKGIGTCNIYRTCYISRYKYSEHYIFNSFFQSDLM